MAKWILITLLVPGLVSADEVVFAGNPSTMIVVGPEGLNSKDLTPKQQLDAGVVVIKRGERYLWASREYRELARINAGAFVTYVATSGSGYVRYWRPEMKSALSLYWDCGEVVLTMWSTCLIS